MSTDVLGYLNSKQLQVKPAPGNEVHLPCLFCNEAPDKRGRLYVNVDPEADIPGLYFCQLCGAHGALPSIMRHFGDRTEQEERADDGFVRRLIFEEATAFYQEALLDNETAYAYLRDRGITVESIEKYRLGYAGGGLLDHLRKRFSMAEILNTGLIADNRVTKRVGDFLTHHITIPYIMSGNVVNVRGRTLKPEDEGRKYVTPFGQKTRLYNTDVVWHADDIVIAEGEFDCYSGDTEVLTEEGWERLDAYRGGRVAQWEDRWPQPARLSFVQPTAFISKHVDRTLELTSGRNGGVSLLVTPGHRMVSTWSDGSHLRVHPADHRPGARFHVPRVGCLDGPGIDLSPPELRLLIAIAADASIDLRKTDAAQYVRFGLSKDRKQDRLRDLLWQLDIDFSDEALDAGYTSICFRVPNYLRAFKVFPQGWLTQASMDQRRLILDELVEWDGNRVLGRNQVEFATSIEANATWVQTLAHTAGHVATIMRRSNSHGEWRKVSILLDKRSSSWQSIDSVEAGPQDVYCLEVPSTMLLVRRHEQVAVSGNCIMAEQLGYAAVACPGAAIWQDAWDGYFEDARRVYLLFDNDVAGRRGAEKVVDHLGSKCRTVVLADESAGKVDLTDWVKQGNGADEFSIVLHRSAGGLLVRVSDCIAEFNELRHLSGGIKFGLGRFDALIRPGLMPAQLMVLLAATGTGKQQPLDEPVLTPDGWRTMGDLVPGDEVIGSDGKPTSVVGVFPQGVQPVLRVTFTDGSWSRCGPEHLWSARTKHDKYRGRPWRTVPASELRRGWHIPLAEPVQHAGIPLPIDPYMLGVLLGDGSLGCSNAGVTVSTDRWIAEHFGWDLEPHVTSDYTVNGYVHEPGLREVLRSLGLWGKRSWEKHVPPMYLLGSPSERLALLRGLLDTDGHPMRSGGVEFCSTSDALIDAVADLTRSLGGVARIAASRVTNYTYRGQTKQGRPSRRVNVKLDASMCPFLLPRKAQKWKAPTKYHCARVVRSVVPDGPPVEQVCIKVANPDGLYVTRDYLLTHNTTWVTNMFQRICLEQPDAKVLFVSLEQTRSEWWDKARRIYRFFNIGASDKDAEDFWNDRIMLVDRNSITPDQLVQCIEDFDYEWGQLPSVVGLDYLGYFAQNYKGERYQKVTDAIMALKGIAKDLRVPIIAPQQVSRKNTRGTEVELDDARDSGVVGETADFLLALWSEDYISSKTIDQRTGDMKFKLHKSRQGGEAYVEKFVRAALTLAMVFEDDGPQLTQWAHSEWYYQNKWSDDFENALIRHESGIHSDQQIKSMDKAFDAMHRKRQHRLRLVAG